MPLYLIRRPAGNAAEPLRNSAGLHSALINAANPAAAITAANVLAAARQAGEGAFSGVGWVVTDIATTPGGLHINCVFDGDPINIRGQNRGGDPA
jgi:hypothetical protein